MAREQEVEHDQAERRRACENKPVVAPLGESNLIRHFLSGPYPNEQRNMIRLHLLDSSVPASDPARLAAVLASRCLVSQIPGGRSRRVRPLPGLPQLSATQPLNVDRWNVVAHPHRAGAVMERPALDELKQAIFVGGNAGEVIRGGSINASPGSISATFSATRDFPLATLLSMIAPTPDWFVGISGVPLFDNNQWVQHVRVQLQPYDAGTDSGTTYTSPNADQNPPVPITQITSYPFWNRRHRGAAWHVHVRADRLIARDARGLPASRFGGES